MTYARVLTSIYLLLVLTAWVAGSDSLWGVYHLVLLPRWLAIVLLALAGMILWLPGIIISAIADRIGRLTKRISGRVLFALFIACMAVLFVVARSKNLLLGDSFRLLPLLSEPMPFSYTEQITLLLLRGLSKIFASPITAYCVIAVGSGVGFLMTVGRFSSEVARKKTQQIAVIAVFLGLAQIQLFFGYVENYALATLFATLFILIGWKSIDTPRLLKWTVALFALAVVFHAVAGFLLPGLVYLLWQRGRRDNRKIFTFLSVAVAVLAVIAGGLYIFKIDDSTTFSPLIASEMNPYTLFSIQHIADVGNLLLLIAPLPLLLVVAYMTKHGIKGIAGNHRLIFLICCTLGGLALLFFVDPKLGALRDWDLLSLYGVPLAFAAIVMWISDPEKQVSGMPILQMALAVMLAHTAPWIISNTKLEPVAKHVKQIIQSDIHYSADYYQADRLMSWGLMCANLCDDIAEMQRCFKIRAAAKPSDQRAWIFYAQASYTLRDSESAREATRHITDLNRLTTAQLENITEVHLYLGESARAREILSEIESRHELGFKYFFFTGLACQLEKKYNDAYQYYMRAREMEPHNIFLLLNFAAVAMYTNHLNMADTILTTARALKDISPEDSIQVLRLSESLSSLLDKKMAKPE